jgi:hypothetical protein
MGRGTASLISKDELTNVVLDLSTLEALIFYVQNVSMEQDKRDKLIINIGKIAKWKSYL